jgi:hypothetical protein
LKTIDLEPHIRKAAKANRRIFEPHQRTQRNWPLCLTCGKDVDAAELKSVNNRSCEIVAHCHGKEDSIKVTWHVPVASVGQDILEDVNVGWAIRRAMNDFCAFDPHGHSENSLIIL